MSELAKILISIFTPTLTALLGLLVKCLVSNKKQKDKIKQEAEMLNYAMGWIDTVLLEQIEMKPDLKKTGHKISKRYHKLDIIPEVAEKSDKEK